MMTLADFLLARIAEDEAAAQAADPELTWPFGTDDDGWGDQLDSEAIAHIARHGPARVLAECEAKRLIVELHGDLDPTGVLYGGPTGECDECSSNDALIPLPCPTLRLLALPYSDHPDFREEWRP